MSVWTSSKFSQTSLTAAINLAPYQPGQISASGLFEEAGIATTTAQIELKDGTLSLVPVVPRGGPAQNRDSDKRRMIPLNVPHLPARATIMAEEVQNIRAFGSESDFETVMAKRDERVAEMSRDLDYTIEFHRLRAIHGVYVDSNNVETSLYAAFGVTPPDPINMQLTTTGTKVRSEKCMQIIRAVQAGLKAATYSAIWGWCGDNFWEKLIGHPSVEKAYEGFEAGLNRTAGDPSVPFQFGGINWVRYRGDSSVGINTDRARIVPVGVRGLCLTRFAPPTYGQFVNTIGRPKYASAHPLPHDKGVDLEAQSNALNVVTRPGALIELTVS